MDALEIQQVRLNEIVLRDDFEPVAVVLEGRDTAGKSSTILELTHYLPTPKLYSRAMVQKINGWCSDRQYKNFMRDVNAWEQDQGIRFIKFWLSISEDEQRARIVKREKSPLTNWKLSPNDKIALSYYDQMTLLKERVLTTTKNWHSINYNDKSKGRLELITTLNNLLGEKS